MKMCKNLSIRLIFIFIFMVSELSERSAKQTALFRQSQRRCSASFGENTCAFVILRFEMCKSVVLYKSFDEQNRCSASPLHLTADC